MIRFKCSKCGHKFPITTNLVVICPLCKAVLRSDLKPYTYSKEALKKKTQSYCHIKGAV